MRLKDWSFLGNYEFFTNRLQMLATNDLPAEKWSYAGKEDFGILRNYLYFTFEKLWKEREEAPDSDKQKYIYMDDKVGCFNTGLYDKTWQPIYFITCFALSALSLGTIIAILSSIPLPMP